MGGVGGGEREEERGMGREERIRMAEWIGGRLREEKEG